MSHNRRCARGHHYFNLFCTWCIWSGRGGLRTLPAVLQAYGQSYHQGQHVVSVQLPFMQISLWKTWTPATGHFLNQQLHFSSNQMLKRRKLKHQQLNDVAVQRLRTPNSKLSVFLLVLSVSPSHSLFVCSLNAQHSHSKWIICHSKRIVLGQVICCSGFVPAWISPLLSSLSQFAPDAPPLSLNWSSLQVTPI